MAIVPKPDVVDATLPLRAGRPLAFFARSGTALHVASGAVQLREPPTLLAEQLHWPRRTLTAGMVSRLPQAGWYELWPLRDGVLELRRRPARFPARRLGRILAAWRQRRAAA